ncbi:hypothetical protein [Brachybacterium sp. YJGR34]|uniref:hypothetical protein n=1 Tax=Brachybacterium sp. YJGR34 TaxID=2059911 RepID=UPI000E0A1C33|nr:hypothetical protein [Brachybacterium sp. YJGR34]
MIDAASRALLSLGCFVGVGAALMLPLTEAGTAERVVSLLALLLGLGIIAGSVAARLLSTRRRHRDEAMADHLDDPVDPTKE